MAAVPHPKLCIVMKSSIVLASLSALVASAHASFVFGAGKNARPGILSAEFAVNGAMVPLCEGKNDLLPVTFTFPVVGEPTPQDFEVIVGDKNGKATGERITPKCATLKPAAEPNERRTVLLLGAFKPTDTTGPIGVEVVGDLALTANGKEVSVKGRCGQSTSRHYTFSSVRMHVLLAKSSRKCPCSKYSASARFILMESRR